ncbi:MAG: hypothetical protein EZS28_006699 [Streblomastix strix]|uniref:KilA/APSES-type HTH DNA-binding domain-containing protein n=1 Tax=Streblomastix strix TaxID=222440 RepID=A0A5J4WSI8_9EUKA|nr:MAG: hypothetical protein EZS28_006699 [Streblomastix strix]
MEEQTAATQQITSNNETFTLGTYMMFEIIIREKDGYVNATKLVAIINEREDTNKHFKTITQSTMYREYKQYLNNKVAGTFSSQQILDYQLINNYGMT